MIIDELRLIQDEHGYLPVEALRALSARTGTPLYHVQGVASFFPHFRLAPPPAVDLGICTDMACHLRGAGSLDRTMEARADGVRASRGGRPASCRVSGSATARPRRRSTTRS